jgi:hypothetical protein
MARSQRSQPLTIFISGDIAAHNLHYSLRLVVISCCTFFYMFPESRRKADRPAGRARKGHQIQVEVSWTLLFETKVSCTYARDYDNDSRGICQTEHERRSGVSCAPCAYLNMRVLGFGHGSQLSDLEPLPFPSISPNTARHRSPQLLHRDLAGNVGTQPTGTVSSGGIAGARMGGRRWCNSRENLHQWRRIGTRERDDKCWRARALPVVRRARGVHCRAGQGLLRFFCVGTICFLVTFLSSFSQQSRYLWHFARCVYSQPQFFSIDCLVKILAGTLFSHHLVIDPTKRKITMKKGSLYAKKKNPQS